MFTNQPNFFGNDQAQAQWQAEQQMMQQQWGQPQQNNNVFGGQNFQGFGGNNFGQQTQYDPVDSDTMECMWTACSVLAKEGEPFERLLTQAMQEGGNFDQEMALIQDPNGEQYDRNDPEVAAVQEKLNERVEALETEQVLNFVMRYNDISEGMKNTIKRNTPEFEREFIRVVGGDYNNVKQFGVVLYGVLQKLQEEQGEQ